jgi:hypothetical protein
MKEKFKKYTGVIAGTIGVIAVALFIGTINSKTGFPNPITVDGQTIEFTYTDDNSGETLHIYTDQEYYTNGLSHALVYVAVVNKSNTEQSVELLGYFRDNKQRIADVQVLTTATEIVSEPIYSEVCTDKEVLGSSTKETSIENVCSEEITGEATSTIQYLKWNPLSIVERTNTEKIKEVVTERKAVILSDIVFTAEKKSEGYTVPVDGVVYYKVLVEFPPRMADGFFFEAIGNAGGYGHLF